jgi:hypothetical protein
MEKPLFSTPDMANVSGVIYQLPREIGEKCVCVVGGSGPGGKLWVSHMQCTDWGDRIINQTQERNSERSISIFFSVVGDGGPSSRKRLVLPVQ